MLEPAYVRALRLLDTAAKSRVSIEPAGGLAAQIMSSFRPVQRAAEYQISVGRPMRHGCFDACRSECKMVGTVERAPRRLADRLSGSISRHRTTTTQRQKGSGPKRSLSGCARCAQPDEFGRLAMTSSKTRLHEWPERSVVAVSAGVHCRQALRVVRRTARARTRHRVRSE